MERERKAALRNRHLSFADDGHGSTIIKGNPTGDAALLKAQIDALAHQLHRTALEERDRLQEEVTWPMRRADALGGVGPEGRRSAGRTETWRRPSPRDDHDPLREDLLKDC
ncbi:MAG: hypothetical protein R2719_11490 [Micropruina sp.]